jgi:hypothetical protein
MDEDLLWGLNVRCQHCNKRGKECSTWLPFYRSCGDCHFSLRTDMTDSMFENCTNCAELRGNGEFAAANRCWQCKGKGFCRKPESYLCNKCGEGMTDPDSKEDRNIYGLIEATVSGGYGSPHLLDMNRYIFSLCEKCLRTLFDECKIPPQMGGEEQSYASDRASYEYNQWIRSSGPREKFAKGLCTEQRNCMNEAVYVNVRSGLIHEEAYCLEHSKRYQHNNNYELIDFKKIAGIPPEAKDQTPEQKRRLADVYLTNVAPGDKISFILYLGDCVVSFIPDHDRMKGTAGIWWPHTVESSPITALVDMCAFLPKLEFESGTLYHNPSKILKKKIQQLNHVDPVIPAADYLTQFGLSKFATDYDEEDA